MSMSDGAHNKGVSKLKTVADMETDRTAAGVVVVCGSGAHGMRADGGSAPA